MRSVKGVRVARIDEPQVLAQPMLGGADGDLSNRNLPAVDALAGPIPEDQFHRLSNRAAAKPHLRFPRDEERLVDIVM